MYLAETVALAAREIVAHAGSVAERYVTFEVDITSQIVGT